ncbi:hypothetical protein [Williamsia serinedens]|uniref:Excreted virulence factor EspC (Type VII ESX diderm) n=1 Tax=Williamsia serinedens TaxID=391736 RepID=A0ABT1H1A4_9NOCA|nr:hypothetical protein [Williamsia serinedens]MCP2160420.1 hypothetical protein [Williamsia serinedens]
MGARMEIDTARVGALARDLAVAADRLHTAARSTAPVLAVTSSTSPWADILSRHDAGLAAVGDVLAGLADRTSSLADALVAAVGTTATRDADIARGITRAGQA